MRPRLIAVDDLSGLARSDRSVFASMRPRLIAVDDAFQRLGITSTAELLQ